jgi:hypothetical protein
MFRLCLRSAALVAPAAFLLALLATPSSAIQRNVTIYQIQDTTSVGHVVEGSTDTVTATGIITGADTRPTGFGFYIEDQAGGFYSGVQVFTYGVNVFADSGYARGDVITATGRLLEFQGGTEIASRTGSSAFSSPPPTTTKIGTAPIPAPLAANFSQVNELAAYPIGERYEGVLVSLTGTGRTALNSFPTLRTNEYLIVDSTLPVASAFDSVRIDGNTLANPASARPLSASSSPTSRASRTSRPAATSSSCVTARTSPSRRRRTCSTPGRPPTTRSGSCSTARSIRRRRTTRRTTRARRSRPWTRP